MFVHVAKKSTFTSELQEQYTNSIVFIKDSQEIYTHGTFYAIPDSYKGKITSECCGSFTGCQGFL